MIKMTVKNNLKNLNRLSAWVNQKRYLRILEKYAKKGVEVLSRATPKDTGKTSESWSYQIKEENNRATIYWTNDNAPYGEMVALLIQYGHATRSGTWVEGIDYINPVMEEIKKDILKSIDVEVQ